MSVTSTTSGRYSSRTFSYALAGISNEKKGSSCFQKLTMMMNYSDFEVLKEMYDSSTVVTKDDQLKQRTIPNEFLVPEQYQYRNLGQTGYMNIFTNPTVTILVGGGSSYPQKEKVGIFHVHKTLLTTCSLFFRAALTSNIDRPSWQEGKTGVLRLPEDRAEDFGMLISWMYQSLIRLQCFPYKYGVTCDQHASIFWHSKIDPRIEAYKKWKSLRYSINKSKMSCEEKKKRIGSRPEPPSFGPLIRLYVLANKYGVQHELGRLISKRVKEVGIEANCVPSKEDVNMVWDQVLTEDAKMEDGLKSSIVEMYGALNQKSFTALFGEENTIVLGESDESSGSNKTDAGVPLLKCEGAECGLDEVTWHQDFLRELLLRVINARIGKLPPKHGESEVGQKRQRK